MNGQEVAISNGLAMILGMVNLFGLIFAVLSLIGTWKIFVKAGKPGWASLIPIYNTIVMLDIVGRPLWWVVLLLIPFVNIVIGIVLLIDLAKVFGKDALFGIGLLLLYPIFSLILGFGDAEYQGGSERVSPSY